MLRNANRASGLSASPPKGLSSEELRRYDLLLAGLDLLDQAVAVFDATPKLVTWNKAMLRLLDFPESLVRVGTPFEDFVRFNAERGEYGSGDMEKLVADRMASVRAFEPHHAERTRPNGKVLSIRGVPIPNLGFVSLWTDVTEQRHYERVIEEQNAALEARVQARTAELEQSNASLARANAQIDQIAAALRKSEERLRLILDSIPALVAHVDAGQRYRYANRGYAAWFGLKKEEIVGRSVSEVFGPEAYAVVRPYLREAAQGERVSYEYCRRNAQGRTVHARSVVVPDVSVEGGFQGYFVLSVDITEQKASEAALIQAQKMEAVGQLTGGLAHDFNNLLTIIIGNLAALKDKQGATPDEYLDPALHAARRGAELIRRLLTFSRRQTLEPRAVDVGAIVRNMLQLLSRSITESITVTTEIPETAIYAMVDPHQLENALVNLAINARDAMPGGGKLNIRISERTIDPSIAPLVEVPAGRYVQFDVADTGSGIDPASLPRVFEPFFTTKPFGAGSGLGLSMVYGFLRQSGGNIRILSTPGEGTSVRFVLPRCEAPIEPRQAAGATSEQAPGGGRLVLLAEDEPEVRRVIRMQLAELGFAVLEVASGIEAREMLEEVDGIELLMTDMVMPGGIGGRELAEVARKCRPGLPVLLMTGYASDAVTGDRSQLGLPVLRKPFDGQALRNALRQLDSQMETGTK